MDVYHRDWFVPPPVVLCVCTQPGEGWIRKKYDNQSYAAIEAAIVMDQITLQAADLDLGTCWIGDFDSQKARVFLSLPDDVEPILFTPLGYPLGETKPKTRKYLEYLFRHDTW